MLDRKWIKTVLFICLLSGVSSLFADTALDVTYFEQGHGSPWADEKLGNNSSITIGLYGCALTCISMIMSYYSENQLTPLDMNRWLKKNDGYEDGYEGNSYLGEVVLNWPALINFREGYIYTRHDWKVKPADILLIQFYLERKVPVIAEVLYKGAPHYVVLTGYDDQGFLMNDPEFPDEHRFNEVYNISDEWGSGPSRNIYGVRVLYSVNHPY